MPEDTDLGKKLLNLRQYDEGHLGRAYTRGQKNFPFKG